MQPTNKKLKMAIISGASHAIRYKEEHPRASEDEVIRFVSREVEEILDKIDKKL